MKSTLAIAALIVGSLMIAGCPGDTADTTQPQAETHRTDVDTGQVGMLDGTQIKSALLADTQVGALDIEVDTTDNSVILRGTVESDAQRQRAEQIARERVDGNVQVINELRVDPTGQADRGTAPGTTRDTP
jgi:Flp pilus assembly secretin CpaC